MFYSVELVSKNIQAGTAPPEGTPFATFRSEPELLAIADEQGWSKETVTGIWNGLRESYPFLDLKLQMMFKNRPYGIAAIWKAIQRLAKREDTTPQPKPERARKAAKRPKPGYRKGLAARNAQAAKSAEPREGSKKARVIAMLQRKQGVSGPELMEAFGWLAHTCRGLLSTLRSKGFAMTSEKDEKRGMVYKAA